MKIITKENCERCHKILTFLQENEINYEQTHVTNPEDIQVYRQLLLDNDKPLGFPIIIDDGEIVNGSSDEILSWLQNRKKPMYFWGN